MDQQAGVHPVFALAKDTARLFAGRKRELARKGPNWDVTQAGDAASQFLNTVARYCLGARQWDLSAEAQLVKAIPGLAQPLHLLHAAHRDLATQSKFFQLADALAVTTPVLEAAEQVAQIVRGAYRAVPPAVSLPWIGLRVTVTQRARALTQALEQYSWLVAAWYEFVFASLPPPSRELQVAHLSAELDIEEEAARCERQQDRCNEVIAGATIGRDLARQTLNDFRKAIAEFEEATYRAAAKPA